MCGPVLLLLLLRLAGFFLLLRWLQCAHTLPWLSRLCPYGVAPCKNLRRLLLLMRG